jgi:rod shape-determining protein MreC
MRFIYTKIFAVIFVGLCLVVLLMFLNSKGGLEQIKKFFLRLPQPLVNISGKVGKSGKEFFVTLYNLKQVAKENIELKYKVAKLEGDLAEAQSDVRDNSILRQELGFTKNSKLNLQPCEVLSVNALNLADSLVLDCGQQQGVIEGQAVLSLGHLIGKVVYSGKTGSTALLANSSKFVTDARVAKTGQVGVVEGSYNTGLILDQLPQSAELEKDWLVVTAGINSVIPKDIPIGEVGEVISSGNDLFKKASLLSPVDFNNLQFVYIVK